MLRLQHRAVNHEVVPVPAPEEMFDLEAARRLLREALGDRVEQRRRELADHVEQERARAASCVTAAQVQAAEIVAVASEERLGVLLAGVDLAVAAPPSLRVVTSDEPAVDPGDVLGTEIQRADASDDRTVEASVLAPDDVVAPTPYPDPAQRGQAVEALTAVQVAAIAAASQVLLHQQGGAPRSAAGRPAADDAAPSRGFWGRWLYLDVLLPMIAVVIVLVVLLAWVG